MDEQMTTKYRRTNFEDGDLEMTDNENSGESGQVDFKIVHSGQNHISLWNRRTTLERVLLILCVALFGLACILIIAMVVSSSYNNKTEYCLTPDCITVASEIYANIDEAVDPCDDFYEYACGGWIDKNPLPAGESQYTIFNKLKDKKMLELKSLLEASSNCTDPDDAKMKARTFYSSCMDDDDIRDELGAKPLLDLIEEYGGWLVLGSWNETEWSLQTVITDMRANSIISSFFDTGITQDDKNSSRNIIELTQSIGGLPSRQYYMESNSSDDLIIAYKKYNVQLAMLLGAENETVVEEYFEEVYDFEVQLANITIPANELTDVSKDYHLLTIEQINQLCPIIDWLEFYTRLLETVGVSVDGSEPVVIYTYDFFTKLTPLLRRTPHRVLHNYIAWLLVRSISSFLSSEFQNVDDDYNSVLLGTELVHEKWKECVDAVDLNIGYALGAMFVEQYFQGSAKEQVEDMINRIKSAFTNNFDNLDWMDQETKVLAKEKADYVRDMIGYPDYILVPDKLNKKYHDMAILPDEYFQNRVRISVFVNSENLKELRQPVKREWEMTPQTVNAYYDPVRNEIAFPAGILQSPFYGKNRPSYINFGAIGMVLGHELTHAFDSSGRSYDKFGNLRPWWNNASVEAFKTQAQCIVDQYSNYSVYGIHVDGKYSEGENIADNGGIMAAYNAYQQWVNDFGIQKTLPAINLSQNQLFFVSAAQLWCSKTTKETVILLSKTNEHSLSKWRVIGPMSNMKEFSEAFKCPENARMNPKDKCVIW